MTLSGARPRRLGVEMRPLCPHGAGRGVMEPSVSLGKLTGGTVIMVFKAQDKTHRMTKKAGHVRILLSKP